MSASTAASEPATMLELAVRLTPHWESHGLFRAGRETLAAALAASPTGAVDRLRAEAFGAVATLATAQGDLDGARAAYEEAIRIHEANGDRRSAASSTNARAVVELRGGDTARAAASCRQALDAFVALGDRRGEAFCRSTAGLVAAATGDRAAALEHLLASLAAFRSLGTGAGPEAAAVLSNLGNVAHDLGDRYAATRFYDGARQAFDRLGDPRGAALCNNNLAMLARDRGDLDRATELATAAIDGFAAADDPHGQAAATNNLAGLWELHGATDEAARLYAEAAERFAALGDDGGAATARHNLAQLRRPVAGLTERESQVAGLVAAGLSNREIAAQLFISERTVHSHLNHAFTKLGVGSRTQLALWFTRQSGAAPSGAQGVRSSASVTRV